MLSKQKNANTKYFSIKKIFSPIAGILSQKTLEYILIDTDISNLDTELAEKIKHISDPSRFLAIGIIMQKPASSRHYTFNYSVFFVCQKQELTADFITHISSNDVEILAFLKDYWSRYNPASYIFTCLLTTCTELNFTLISNRAVAPHYQKNGLMKRTSLNLIECLAETYGGEHEIRSETIHPATYLFFNPEDKNLEGFNLTDIPEEEVSLGQERTCAELIAMHANLEVKKHFDYLKNRFYMFKTVIDMASTTPGVNIRTASDRLSFKPF